MLALRRFLNRSGLLAPYHFALALLGALIYGFPSRKLIVIGVTGTNGKSSTVEFINSIFETAGYRTALSSSIRVKVDRISRPSIGRSMPGRFFIQRFLRSAVDAKCTVAIVEMTSEGARQYRHRGISLDAFVFLNLAPEHIESHGSLEKYASAKFALARQLVRSRKRPRVIVANADDAQGERYLRLSVERAIGFKRADVEPWHTDERGGEFTFNSAAIRVNIPGTFYIQNAQAAAVLAASFGITTEQIRSGIARIMEIPGRMQRVNAGQSFPVIVDYALTPDALEELYRTYPEKKICVFGGTGGGRDTWKRPVLGEIAERYCDTVILTNDIAYDEDPMAIAEDIARGMQRTKPEIILDRRAAIRRGIQRAREIGDAVVLITGMGIDNELTGADGTKIPWSDCDVAREEIKKVLAKV